LQTLFVGSHRSEPRVSPSSLTRSWPKAGCSAGGPQSGVIGWLNRKMFEETGDEEKSQGWTALIPDTNANGKRDDYVEPNQALDPAKDKRINAAIVANVDACIRSLLSAEPGRQDGQG